MKILISLLFAMSAGVAAEACSLTPLAYSSMTKMKVIKHVVESMEQNKQSFYSLSRVYDDHGGIVIETIDHSSSACEASVFNVYLGADCSMKVTKLNTEVSCMAK